MHQSTLKPQFRVRCVQCNSYSAQSYRSAAQSIICHHCHVYIGTPACKVCQSEDTQAHQPKNGRWQCNGCGGTFTYRSQPTRAEKRRQITDRYPPQKETNDSISDDQSKGSMVSVCYERSTKRQRDNQNSAVSVLNDEIRALISTAVGCTNNRNLVFPIHDFQCKLEGVLETSDNIYSCGLVSSSDLASAAEEALYSCYIIELAQALLKLAARGEFSGLLAILIYSPSVRSALDEKFIRLIEFVILQQSSMDADVDIHGDHDLLNEEQVEYSDADVASEPSSSITKNMVSCHRTNATTQTMEDIGAADQFSYDVDWRWYRPTTILTRGFSVRLLN